MIGISMRFRHIVSWMGKKSFLDVLCSFMRRRKAAKNMQIQWLYALQEAKNAH